ncbi:MAG: hypothetical protein SCK57_09175 [Bacillota bacterium]|nr:hypothetical protein [Bacillota bacterium]MDW7677819.1 hypothetical protein [Bacillota bacterium]
MAFLWHFWKNRLLCLIAWLLIISVAIAAGCSRDLPQAEREEAKPEIKLDPLFLPDRQVPTLTTGDAGLVFQWPGETWDIFEDVSGIYVVDQALEYRMDLQLKRQQLNILELAWRADEFSVENVIIRKIEPLLEGFLLTAENRQGTGLLIHLRNLESGDMELLTENPAGSLLHLISPDGSKVAYQSADQGIVTTYHTVTGRKMVLAALTQDQFCGDWTEQTRFSPLGGYVTVEMPDCETGRPVQFTTYGADTGRLIHQPLPGKSPRWDPDERKIVFIIQPDAASDTALEDDRTQLAVYFLDRRELQFLNRVQEGFQIHEAPIFSRQDPLLLYAVARTEEQKLVMYHLDRQVQQTLPLPGPDQVPVSEDGWLFVYPLLVVPVVTGEATALFIYDYQSELMEMMPSVSAWVDSWEQTRYLMSDGGSGFYYLSDNRLMHTAGGNHQVIMTLPPGSSLEDLMVSQQQLMVVMRSGKGDKTAVFPGL